MYRFLYCVIIFFISSVNSKIVALSVKILSEIELSRFSVIDENVSHSGTDACIRKITDGKAIYIFKQIDDSSMSQQLLLINDCVASSVGIQAGISINEVCFVPYTVGAHLKKYPERAATLHTYVAGCDVDLKLPLFLSTDFSIHQRVIDVNSAWQKQYPLLAKNQGLSKLRIESMSFHKQLPSIVALDTFIGNGDRSKPNIFYDEHKGCFCGIDHAAAFGKTLPFFACERLKELVHEGYFKSSDKKIVDGLRIYLNTLQRLHSTCQPSVIREALSMLIPYLASHAVDNSEIKKRLCHHEVIIENNYMVTAELIELLKESVCCIKI